MADKKLFITTTGSGNAYIATFSPVQTAYRNGEAILMRANHTNTGASTLNKNGLGAKSIKINGSEDVVAGDIISGQTYWLCYDSVNGYYQIV